MQTKLVKNAHVPTFSTVDLLLIGMLANLCAATVSEAVRRRAIFRGCRVWLGAPFQILAVRPSQWRLRRFYVEISGGRGCEQAMN